MDGNSCISSDVNGSLSSKTCTYCLDQHCIGSGSLGAHCPRGSVDYKRFVNNFFTHPGVDKVTLLIMQSYSNSTPPCSNPV